MSAKEFVIIGLKVVVAGFLLCVCFVLGSMVSGLANLEASTPPATAASAGGSADQSAIPLALLGVSILQAAVLAFIILRSRWSGWKLVGGVFIAFAGVNTVLGTIEAAVYLPTQLPAGAVPRIFAMGMFTAALFSPIAVLVLGRMRRRLEEETPNVRLVMPVGEWVWEAAAIAVVYLIVYYTFGYFVAWKNPAVQQFYGGTDPGSLFKQIASVWSSTPWMFPFQAFRGLLFMAFALPVVRMLKGKRWEVALAVALLFSILGGAPLALPNPFMPEAVAKTHLVEVTSSNFIFGWVVGWLLSRRHSSLRDLLSVAEA